MRGALFALAFMVTAPTYAQMLPQQFKGDQGRYEMCLKRRVLELRKVRGKAMEPLDEIASAQA